MNITVAGACLNQTPIDWENNKQNIIYAVEYARMNGAQFLCLPELCITGYGCEDLFLSDWIYETAIQKLLEIKEYCFDITVAVGIPIKFEGHNYNCACLIHNTQIMGFYAKQFLANDGIHYETRWFDAWKWISVNQYTLPNGQVVPLGDAIFEIPISQDKTIKIGFEICEDSWRKEQRPGYRHKQRGVDIIFNPSASHFAFGKTKIRHDELVIKGSEDFNCVYVFANLLGNEAGRAIYDGEIMIAQAGRLLSRNRLASFQAFNVQIADIDLQLPNQSKGREPIEPFLPKNEEFTAILPLALYDYMRKSRSSGYTLSLSGGADSSCCAVMVAEMKKRGMGELGEEYFYKRANLNIAPNGNYPALLTCVYQATENSSQATFTSAIELAASVEADFISWNIDDTISTYIKKVETALQRPLQWNTDDLALQNIQSRARNPAVWMIANLKNALLIATSNRSEGDLGYCTMDGDTAGSISPIAGVDKDFVKHWLLWAEAALGYPALSHVNNLAPTAELRPLAAKQTDEADLMPYYILNEIEKLAIRQWKSPLQVYEMLLTQNLCTTHELKNYIHKFYTLWARNQWKRERLAPSFHLDEHNVDSRTWCRFPILSGGFTDELKKLQI